MCHLQVAEVDHPIHHLTDTEAVAEVVERVVPVVLLNCQLGPRGKKKISHWPHGRASIQTCLQLPVQGYEFTSQRFSVMGFMLNSFTSPRSWYMYSKQLSIFGHKGSLVWLGFESFRVQSKLPATDLVMFPVPDVKRWLFQCLDGLLRQRVLSAQDKTRFVRISEDLHDKHFG